MIRLVLLCGALALNAAAALAQQAPAPDELLALTFYLQQQDSEAVRAELRRLQVKYPDWQPPDDLSRLSGAGPAAEIDSIYRLIADGNYDAARESIRQAQQDFPDWRPPEQMQSLLATNEGQELLDQALSEADLDDALALAASRPGLLRCDRINNAWRIAEAQIAADRIADALATYRAVLSACLDAGELQATLEKASELASPDELRAMVEQVTSRFPDRADDLQALENRLLAGSQATAHAPEPAPAPRPASRDSAAAAAAGRQSPAYQRAWRSYDLNRPMQAIDLFQSALASGLGADQRRDAHYGMALAYLRLQMPEEAAKIAARTRFTQDQRLDIERQILDQRGVAAYRKRQYRDAIAFFDAFENLTGSLRRDLAILRAYAYLNSRQTAHARREFLRLHDELATNETRRGLAATE